MIVEVALGVAYLAIVAVRAVSAAHVAARQTPCAPHRGAGVDVAQAILSGDPRLADVLGDSVRALPESRFLWLVDEHDAVAQSTCAAVKAAHPDTRIDVILTPPAPDRTNPKLWKLEAARLASDAPVFFVLDDDTRMTASTLGALMRALETHDLATSLPVYRSAETWPSQLLAQFVANNAAVTYLSLQPWVAPVTINGMAYAIRRSTLDAMGGFAPLLRHLTDDLAVASRVRERGGAIAQVAAIHEVETTVRDLTHYLQLMHRWTLFALLLMRTQPVRVQALVTLVLGLPPMLLMLLVLRAWLLPAPLTLVTLAVVLIVRSITIASLHRAVGTPGLQRAGASIASELWQPVHLVHALVSPVIVWRTRRYRVRANDDFEAA
ncbi:MAG: glycosyltransferase [Vicinamibacterales bacterium]